MDDPDPEISQKALEIYDKILHVSDAMWGERMDKRPALTNANRTHRLRSLVARAAISFDYNRPITDRAVWYDTTDKRVNGFYPDVIFDDLIELCETNFYLVESAYRVPGLYPDGTICHHCRLGVEWNVDAYGFPWLKHPVEDVFIPLKNTPYKVQDKTFDLIADRILDAYRSINFKSYVDIAIGSFVEKNFDKEITELIQILISAKSTSTTIKRESELEALKSIYNNQAVDDDLQLNQAFWNNDALIHRRPNYYMSAKMISERTRAPERGYKYKGNYYLGDGVLTVKTHGLEYHEINSVFNHHAMPGTTAEQRNDDLPLNAASGFQGAMGTNTYAGVISDGTYGFGAFIYERNFDDDALNYSTVNARKSFFFHENKAIALGNSVKRARPGDANEIWTVLNQTRWNTDITYNKGNGKQTIAHTLDNTEQTIDQIDNITWFLHDNVGYIIVPADNQTLKAKIITKNTGKTDHEKKVIKIMQLVIDHGTNPTDDSYQYILLPDVTEDAVIEYVEKLKNKQSDLNILKNDNAIIATQNNELDLTQVVFFAAGSLDFTGKDQEPLTLTVDRPALVMLNQKSTTIDISVTDPNHSTSSPSIQLSINKKLYSGDHSYYDPGTKTSNISFTHSTVPTYAGKTISKTLSVFTSLSVTATLENPKCKGESSGTVSLSVEGGVQPIVFSKDDGVSFQTSATFTHLPAGQYSMTIKDALNNQKKLSLILEDPPALAYTVSKVMPATVNTSDGKIILEGNLPPPLWYSIDDQKTFQSSGTFNNLKAGTYKIAVKNEKECLITGTVTLTAKAAHKPSGFIYTPNTIETQLGQSGNSINPEVNWNNDKGLFKLDTDIKGISINTQTGVINWSAQLQVGPHILIVTAYNSSGNVTTTFTLTIKNKKVIDNDSEDTTQNNEEKKIPPSEFNFNPDRLDGKDDQPGQSAAPKINWNGEVGSFRLINSTVEEIKIDSLSGVISWGSGLASGTYEIKVTASNSIGSVSTTLSLTIKNSVLPPSDIIYIPDNYKTPFDQAAHSTIPQINWNGDKGIFSFENKVDAEFSINALTGQISWTQNLKEGTHTLVVVAQNKMGSIKTNIVIIKEKRPIFPPSDFSYPVKNLNSLFHESGTSTTPLVSWNGEQGTFTLENDFDGKVSIDPKSGVISWSPVWTTGTYSVKINASNSMGSVQSELKIVIHGPKMNKNERFTLHQNYPNPTDNETYFVYNLTWDGMVSINLFNTNGKWIENMMEDRFHKKGRHIIKVKTNHLPSGIYLFILYSKAEGYKTIRFMVKK